MVRPSTSIELPAGAVMRKRIGLSGHAWAPAVPVRAAATSEREGEEEGAARHG